MRRVMAQAAQTVNGVARNIYPEAAAEERK
jgi:hypothetical protein